MSIRNQILLGDTLTVLKEMPDRCVDMIITSPPYWGLRNYGVEGQLGLEATIEEHIFKMMDIMIECKRVLADYGTLWLNYGDTYTKKSMCLVPERLAISMVDDGWILRNKIIWHKPSVVPQSAKDRFTNDWEYIYFFSKKPKGYYFEQQFEPIANSTKERGKYHITEGEYDSKKFIGENKQHRKGGGKAYIPKTAMRNCRSVWKVSSQAVKEAHFATFPFKLIERPIRAGCPELVCTGKKSPVIKTYEQQKPPEEVLTLKEKEGDELIGSFHRDGKTVGSGQKLQNWRNENPPIETLIDGCGKPVIPVIEKTYDKRGERTDTGKYMTDETTSKLQGHPTDVLSVNRIATTATHCSCGAPFRRGIVMDIFMGSGTTAIVARALDRDYVGIELNPEYIEMAEKRLKEWPKEKVLAKLNEVLYKEIDEEQTIFEWM